jgi:mannitol/fructose-specific phosphotransferase system IIA component (Ntr-type)
VPGKELICYYDSRERWLERNGIHLKANPAITELSYLLPPDAEILSTFKEVASVLTETGARMRLIEASDTDALCDVLQTA